MAGGKLRFVVALLLFSISSIGRSGDELLNDPQPQVANDIEREFTLNVLPVFKAKCLGCHGDDVTELKKTKNFIKWQLRTLEKRI